MTIITTVIFGLIYPFAVTGLAQLLFPSKANGSLIYIHGSNGQATAVGSRLLGQAFTGPGYFHSRPSMAGDGYDGGDSRGFGDHLRFGPRSGHFAGCRGVSDSAGGKGARDEPGRFAGVGGTAYLG